MRHAREIVASCAEDATLPASTRGALATLKADARHPLDRSSADLLRATVAHSAAIARGDTLVTTRLAEDAAANARYDAAMPPHQYSGLPADVDVAVREYHRDRPQTARAQSWTLVELLQLTELYLKYLNHSTGEASPAEIVIPGRSCAAIRMQTHRLRAAARSCTTPFAPRSHSPSHAQTRKGPCCSYGTTSGQSSGRHIPWLHSSHLAVGAQRQQLLARWIGTASPSTSTHRIDSSWATHVEP